MTWCFAVGVASVGSTETKVDVELETAVIGVVERRLSLGRSESILGESTSSAIGLLSIEQAASSPEVKPSSWKPYFR